MNDNQKNAEQNAAQPQQNVGDPKGPDQAPAQNAPGEDQPAKTGESSPDRDTPKQSSGPDQK